LTLPLGEILSLGSAVLWSLAVVLFQRAVSVPAAGINLYKNTLAFVLMVLTLVSLEVPIQTDRSTEDWLRLLASGALGLGFADTVFVYALKRTGPGIMAIIETVYSPAVAILVVVLNDEQIPGGFWIGAPLVLGGLLVATWPTASTAALGDHRERTRGIVLGVFALVCMALAITIAKPALERSNVIEAALVRMVSALTLQVVWTACRRDRRAIFRVLLPGPHVRWITPSAFLGAYLAMICWLGGMKLTAASVSAVLNQMSTIFTLLFAWLIVREPLTRRRVVAAVLAFCGTAVIVSRAV
jgi:drug/metabolite transporter (DMT)-like permease